MATTNEQRTKARERREAKDGGGSATTAALLGTAAAGFAVGIAAMIGRKIAVQAPTYIAGEWDEALAAEHKAVLAIFDALEATTTANTTKRTILLTQLKHALAKHALQEENAVYPALRDAGLEADADELNTEHGYIKQALYELTNTPRDSERFMEIIRRFRDDVKSHADDEEQNLYPQLKAKLSAEGSHKLTVAMNREGFKLA